MKKNHLSTSQNRRLKVKTIKRDKFSDFHKLMLPLILVSLLYAIVAGGLTT
ncbi:MAG: hypothetical protein OQL09_05245 [Gammaproteobacteria bacterium]|nr:hypothetical protein [Gammaproteobacteria bacterium]